MFTIHRDGKESSVFLNEHGALADEQGWPYKATFNGRDVIMTGEDGEQFLARWKLDGTELRNVPGSGALHNFSFTFFDYGLGNQRLHSLWTFDGNSVDAIKALKEAGYHPAFLDNRFNRSSQPSASIPLFHMRSRGSLLTGEDSGHAILHLERNSAASQARGELHVGEHNPVHPIGFFLHRRKC